MMAGAIIVGGVLVIGVMLVAAGGAAYLTVGPADQAARRRKADRQYTLTDLITLLVVLQVTLAPAAWLFRLDTHQQGVAIFVGIMMWAAAGMLWWSSVNMMARAGVTQPVKRALFVLAVLPLSLAGVIGGITLPGLVAGVIADPTMRKLHIAALVAGAVLGWIVAVLGTRTLTKWIVTEETSTKQL